MCFFPIVLHGNFNTSDLQVSSEILLELKENIDMPFRNMTRIQFGASLILTGR